MPSMFGLKPPQQITNALPRPQQQASPRFRFDLPQMGGFQGDLLGRASAPQGGAAYLGPQFTQPQELPPIDPSAPPYGRTGGFYTPEQQAAGTPTIPPPESPPLQQWQQQALAAGIPQHVINNPLLQGRPVDLIRQMLDAQAAQMVQFEREVAGGAIHELDTTGLNPVGFNNLLNQAVAAGEDINTAAARLNAQIASEGSVADYWRQQWLNGGNADYLNREINAGFLGGPNFQNPYQQASPVGDQNILQMLMPLLQQLNGLR